MAEATSNRRPIIILVAVLVAVVAASLAVVFLLPDQGEITTSTQEPTTEETATSLETFDLGVLQRTDYKALNTGLIESKQLPVQPFVGAGKANPFL